jgi:hypothetical protein
MAISESPAPTTTRRTVASFTSYAPAEQAVDKLSDHGFPVEHAAIIGTGLRYVEQVTGRVTTGRATLLGLGYGTVFGVLWGLLFGGFFTVDSGSFFGVLVYSVAVGLVFGGVFGAAGHIAQGGRRDFGSASETRPDHYELQVDERYADRAELLLSH